MPFTKKRISRYITLFHSGFGNWSNSFWQANLTNSSCSSIPQGMSGSQILKSITFSITLAGATIGLHIPAKVQQGLGMWSKELESRIVKHELHGVEIINYAGDHLFTGRRHLIIEKISLEITKTKAEISQITWLPEKEPNEESKKAEAFFAGQYKHLEKMIEEYRQEETDIEKQKNNEKKGDLFTGDSVLPINPILEQLTKKENENVLRPWYKGKYKCSSLKEFIKKYTDLADNLTPDLIRDYLISERHCEPYDDNHINNMIDLHRPYKK